MSLSTSSSGANHPLARSVDGQQPPDDQTHFVNLRVMKLAQASTDSSLSSYLDEMTTEVFEMSKQSQNITAYALAHREHQHHPTDATTGDNCEIVGCPLDTTIPCSESNHSFLLPTSQGNTCVGEVFRAFMSVANVSDMTLTRVSLTVEVLVDQRSSRHVLFDNVSSPWGRLDPQKMACTNIAHHVDTVGPHTISCTVTYVIPSYNLVRKMRRYFQFDSVFPFKVSHQVNFINTRAHVQVALENTTKECILLTDAAIQCTPPVSGVRLDSAEQDNPSCGYRGVYYFRPEEVYNIVFTLSLHPNTDRSLQSDPLYLKRLSSLGKLSLEWKTRSGGSGTLSTYSIGGQRKWSRRPIELVVLSCPSSVQLEDSFVVEFGLVNRLDRAVEPLLLLDRKRMQPLHTPGIDTQSVGSVASKSIKQFTLPMVALETGLHSLNGITLYDPLAQQAHDWQHLCEILAF
eukprot:CAMPEP_0113845828 /NCGR_PEP_ID=MMETSP0372-20130328/972_1 /TAXON_ID=340204 /ORGANISM="Lankesteria abbotti" /LENGTH=458 /DNA_ID=CAMNT_0000814911 /DNA_START=236 /DNA_END=1612 /DNA_ORIENTATION=+ /assembly_acc=CAM_ASM_000359